MKIVSLTSPQISNQPQVRQNHRASVKMTAPLTHDQVNFGNARALVTDAEKILIKETREVPDGVAKGLIFTNHVLGQERPIVALKAKKNVLQDVLNAWANNAEQLHVHSKKKVSIYSIPPVTTKSFQKAFLYHQNLMQDIKRFESLQPLSKIIQTMVSVKTQKAEAFKQFLDKAGITVKKVKIKDIDAQ